MTGSELNSSALTINLKAYFKYYLLIFLFLIFFLVIFKIINKIFWKWEELKNYL